MLTLEKISKTYNPGTVREMALFDSFSLSIEEGQFLSVVGSNGSGKTSLLNILCGSIPVDSGRILLDGEDITHQKEHLRARRIARIYQNPAMGTCAQMSIQENMALADCKFKRMNLRPGTDRSRLSHYNERKKKHKHKILFHYPENKSFILFAKHHINNMNHLQKLICKNIKSYALQCVQNDTI